MKERRILIHSGLIYQKCGVDHIVHMISPNSLFWQQKKKDFSLPGLYFKLEVICVLKLYYNSGSLFKVV